MTLQEIFKKIEEIKRAILGIKQQLPKISVKNLAEAMAAFEGFYIPNSVAQRNNNPCNLRWSKFQTAAKNGFAYFTHADTGWNACVWDLSMKCQGKTQTKLTPESTIKDLIYVWAPPSDNNNTEKYVFYICTKLGIKPTFQLKNFVLT